MGTRINAQIMYSKCMPIVIIIASWTIIIVMHIIITLKNGALIVDCCRMMMSRTMMGSIGECRVGQTHHGAAKSMRNFMHSEAVMTEGIHFEYMFRMDLSNGHNN